MYKSGLAAFACGVPPTHNQSERCAPMHVNVRRSMHDTSIICVHASARHITCMQTCARHHTRARHIIKCTNTRICTDVTRKYPRVYTTNHVHVPSSSRAGTLMRARQISHASAGARKFSHRCTRERSLDVMLVVCMDVHVCENVLVCGNVRTDERVLHAHAVHKHIHVRLCIVRARMCACTCYAT